MNNDPAPVKFIALLRGINVGGHHKVPMADLRKMMEQMGFSDVTTLLNSGNVIFRASPDTSSEAISRPLEAHFGFPIPVILIKAKVIQDIISANPFNHVDITKDIRFYVTFLKQKPALDITLPWISDDSSFRILEIKDNHVCSVFDLSATTTPKGMDALEQFFGKDITTRNWNTIKRIAGKI